MRAYRGELLGLLAIHLILLAVNINSGQTWSELCVSVWTALVRGALGRVVDLPVDWLPSGTGQCATKL